MKVNSLFLCIFVHFTKWNVRESATHRLAVFCTTFFSLISVLLIVEVPAVLLLHWLHSLQLLKRLLQCLVEHLLRLKLSLDDVQEAIVQINQRTNQLVVALVAALGLLRLLNEGIAQTANVLPHRVRDLLIALLHVRVQTVQSSQI